MKKILSVILCSLFLNFVFYPAVFADDTVQQASDAVSTTNSDITTQNPTEDVNQSDTENQAAQPNTPKTEHLALIKNKSKKISVESVYLTSHDVIIPADDILQVAFVNDFNGRKAKVGDTIEFRFPNDIVTQEGTTIIPSTARIVAAITQLKRPKPFHLSGKVYLDFKYIQFIDGTQKPIQAKICGKKEFLSRKTLNNTTAVGETAVAYGAGAVTGAVIGGASSNVFMIILGSTFGAGIGAIAGITLGIILPGASFKAKAGQRVNIQLTSELDI